MDVLIDRDKLLEFLNEWKKKTRLSTNDVIGIIENQPGVYADVNSACLIIEDKIECMVEELREFKAMIIEYIEGRHGRWIKEDDDKNHICCSNCDLEIYHEWECNHNYPNYCPSCGAKMDEVV